MPAVVSIDEKILKNGDLLKQAITSIRDARNKNQVKPKETIELSIETGEIELYKYFERILSKQVNAEKTHYILKAETGKFILTGNDVNSKVNTNQQVGTGMFTLLGNDVKFHIKTNQQIDSTVQKEQLQKDLDYLKGFLVSVEKKLSNERFVQNAKPAVIESERKKKADAEEKIKVIEESLAAL